MTGIFSSRQSAENGRASACIVSKEAQQDTFPSPDTLELAESEQWQLPTSWMIANEGQGFVPLPKSVTHSRIEENANVYDFELDAEDMKRLDTGEYAPSTWDPTTSRD